MTVIASLSLFPDEKCSSVSKSATSASIPVRPRAAAEIGWQVVKSYAFVLDSSFFRQMNRETYDDGGLDSFASGARDLSGETREDTSFDGGCSDTTEPDVESWAVRTGKGSGRCNGGADEGESEEGE